MLPPFERNLNPASCLGATAFIDVDAPSIVETARVIATDSDPVQRAVAVFRFVRDSLALFGATPSNERWVIDRNRATGGGVTAGIDFGLAVLSHLAGPDLARVVQLALEYSPQPPFRSGTPEEAAPQTLATLRAMWGGKLGERIQSRLLEASQRLRKA